MEQPKDVAAAKEELSKKAHETAGEQTGACVYNAGGKTYCAVLTREHCSQLHGYWYVGKSC